MEHRIQGGFSTTEVVSGQPSTPLSIAARRNPLPLPSCVKHCEGSGTGLILTISEDEYFKCALCFLFDANNNETEYEALIASLRLAKDIGVNHIRVFSDSQLIVGQITGKFDAKEETMQAYKDIALPLVRLFNIFQIKHIPRSENSKADEMA
ncbi:uncharacterized protein LOC114286969 [Camellia sinensis]|uniref:uncharacterized protein LOC114286969 n=1 Tax=Camellia sinensis TaxID=4442 RepID=UPI00103565E4|nr:uncharacterized protein LOC114286969 [Camellia sinensis]